MDIDGAVSSARSIMVGEPTSVGVLTRGVMAGLTHLNIVADEGVVRRACDAYYEHRVDPCHLRNLIERFAHGVE